MRLFLFFLLLSNLAFADVYMLYDKTSGQVVSVSEADDAVQPVNTEKVVLKGKKIPDLDLTYPHDFYKYEKDRVKLDSKRLENEAKKEIEARKQAALEAEIQAELRIMALERIQAKGEVQ